MSDLNLSPIVITGNQKTGSTAIAALLAKAANKSVQLDIFYKIKEDAEKKILSGEMTFREFAHGNMAVHTYEPYHKDFVMIRYEDFSNNKGETICQLARDLQLEPTCEILDSINIQYQSKGNQDVG